MFQEISSKKPTQNFKQGKRGGYKKQFRGGRGGANNDDTAAGGGFERAGPSTAKNAGGEDNFYRADKAKE